MTPLSQSILEFMSPRPEGSPLRAKELLHLGERAAVDQALSRLHRRGKLLRVGRGIYALPIEGRFGARAPSPSQLVKELSRATGETITSHGAAAANALGLTTQVPVKSQYLTSGRNRRMAVGGQTVELRHAPPWQLHNANDRAGEVVRALSWLGKTEAPRALATLRSRLSAAELQTLVESRANLPTWMAREISTLMSDV